MQEAYGSRICISQKFPGDPVVRERRCCTQCLIRNDATPAEWVSARAGPSPRGFPGLCGTRGPRQGKSRARPSAGSGVRQGDAAGVSFCSPALVTRKSRPGAHLKSIGAFASEDLPQTLLLSRRTPRPSHQKAAPPPHGRRAHARGARLSPPRAPAPARIRPTPRRPTFHALQVPAMPREPAWTATRPGLVRKRHRCDRRARVKEQRIQRSPDVAIGSAHDARARTSLWRRRGPFPGTPPQCTARGEGGWGAHCAAGFGGSRISNAGDRLSVSSAMAASLRRVPP